jgi:hypothetical protein
MEYVVDTLCQAVHHGRITNISLDESQSPGLLRAFKVTNIAAGEVIENPNFSSSLLKELVYGGAPHKPGPAGYKYSRSLNRIHWIPFYAL